MSGVRTPRLGRGLAALLGEPAANPGLRQVHSLAAHSLDPNPHQPRGPIDAASVQELTDSIRAQGILQPLLVRHSPHSTGRFEIIAGERRWRAAQLAGLTEIPCLIHDMDDHQSAAAALVENLQRLDLNAIEEAEGFDRLITQFQITQEALAEIVGKSRSHVANTLRLLKLPDEIKTLVQTGSLSAGHARALLTHPTPLEAARHIVDHNLSVRQTEALGEKASKNQSVKEPENRDPDLVAVEKDLSDQLGMIAKLRANGGKGSLTIHFTRLEQLDFLIARLGSSGTLNEP